MPSGFDHKAVEAKWQKIWEETGLFRAQEGSSRPKTYILDMFPYPSAAGLHVGHPEGYTATDILSRMKRMQGYDVLHPMGWDAFGLPAENYAIQTGVHPRLITQKNIENFRRQIKSIGFSYDWSREIDTTDPAYYKWTQWIFLALYKKGLAYEGVAPINFCPQCKTGLANEEVHQGACERCGSLVERRSLRQWMLKITAYADRLLEDLDGLDWPESTLAMQRNWIGKSQGAEVIFETSAGPVAVFTTRPDTLFGATYLVLAPEHPMAGKLVSPGQRQAVSAYRARSQNKSDLERTDLAKEKTGVFTGATAKNPVNGQDIPVWLADYVLMSYGTGAIMAVPAHDQRDHDFAVKFGLPIKEVVARKKGEGAAGAGQKEESKAYEEEGFAVNSGAYDGLSTAEAKERITADLEKSGKGKKAVNYRLRDWVFSRQRYWGEPIPIVHCKGRCQKAVPVPESQLPVLLPEMDKFEPLGTGDSPLAGVTDWVETTCPECGGKASRETNTMPQWAGSCWYYLRYADPSNAQRAWDPAHEKRWLDGQGVDLYVGGAEHAVLHLLYSRFWHKVLFDLGLVSSKEPFRKLRHQGMVLSYSYRDRMGAYHAYDEIDFSKGARLKATGEALDEQVEKMSKSKKNVVSPDEIIEKYGADAMRLYEMFMGDFEQPKPWDMRGVEGVTRFLQRVWRLLERPLSAEDPHAKVRHKTIQSVTERIEGFKFNTAIAALMEYANLLTGTASRRDLDALVLLLSPFAPHQAEEMWERLGHKESVLKAPWPQADPAHLKEDKVEYPVQVNGKVRDLISVDAGSDEEAVVQAAKSSAKTREFIKGHEIVKVIFIRGRMVNFVVRPVLQKESA